MTKPFVQQTTGYEVTEHIYVKDDGRTVCGETDKDVASLAYARGERISEAQFSRLIFPGSQPATPEPVLDASQRSAEVLPDTEKRRGRKSVG